MEDSTEHIHQHRITDRFGITGSRLFHLSQAASRLMAKDVEFRVPDEEMFMRYAPAIIAIAHSIDTESGEKRQLSSDEIAQMSRSAKAVLKISGVFGQHGKDFVSRQVEHIAAKKIDKYAKRISSFIDSIEGVRNPKAEFLQELQILQNQVASNTKTLQEVAVDILQPAMPQGKDPKRGPDTYPLLRAVCTVAGISLHSSEVYSLTSQVNVVTPEVLGAIQVFLQYHGQYTSAINTVKPTGIKRMAAEEFKGEDLQRVKQQLPYILEGVYNLLPDHGKSFSQGIRMQMELLAKSDKTPQETLKVHGWI